MAVAIKVTCFIMDDNTELKYIANSWRDLFISTKLLIKYIL